MECSRDMIIPILGAICAALLDRDLDLMLGGIKLGGKLIGNGCPDLTMSARNIAKENSSEVSRPSESTSANVLQNTRT